MKNPQPIELLLVEDNPGDIRLTEEAWKESRSLYRLNVVSDGVEALAFLRKEGPYARTPRPDMIFMDLNLPKRDGRDVLQEIKSDPVLRYIPVIVMTTSNADQDVLKSYSLHANCYISKPLDIDRFIQVIRTIEEFWINIVTLPPR
ncbi:MAG: response regulator [Planctomycetes bacterium]|nr:response regulator [Planctomycetota bacterium]